MKNSKSVSEYILAHKDWMTELEILREIVLGCGLTETIKWGSPVYTSNGKNIVGIGAFKSYCGLWFFQGALLKDEANKLMNAQEGVTKALRQWRIHSPREINKTLMRKYILEAVTNQEKGKEIKPVAKKKFTLPEELNELFKNNKILKEKFLLLTPFKQREFADYIHEARREETRLARIKKITPLLLAGIGLNDKYRK